MAELCRKGSARLQYGGPLPTEMRRLKQLEDENAKLRRVVADLSLDEEMLQDRAGSAKLNRAVSGVSA